VLLLANLAVANQRGFSPWREILTLGLVFGQLGGLSAWAFVATRPSWAYRVAACYVVATASVWIIDTDALSNTTRMVFLVSIFLLYVTMALGIILAWNVAVGLASSRSSGQRAAAPRFQVRHLLIASVVVAVLSAIAKVALPGWVDAKLVRIFALLVESALLSLAAYVLVGKPAFRWSRLAMLVAVGVVLAAGAYWVDDYFRSWSHILSLNAIEIAVLVAVLVVSRLDRYSLQVSFAPRSPTQSEQDEQAESDTSGET